MCNIFTGHIVIDREHKDFGKVLYYSGIHHEKDREKILAEYGPKVRIVAWETKQHCSFAEGVVFTHSRGDITQDEAREFANLVKSWVREQDQVELFLRFVSITQGGVPLPREKFHIDLDNRSFVSRESFLVLDFSKMHGWAFITGDYCTFVTGSDCAFKATDGCTFKTGGSCMFKTANYCTFVTGSGCTFETSGSCMFKTGSQCLVVRRDVYEVIEVPSCAIKLNGPGVKGFTRQE